MRLRGLGAGGWEIAYPLPDGSRGTFHVVYTQPSALREGMSVGVLVEASNPHNARLDHAPHARVRNVVVGLIVGFFALIAICGVAIAVAFVLLSRL